MAGLIQCVVCLSCCGLLPVFIYGSVVVYGAEAKTQCSTKFALQYVDEIGLCNIQCVWRTRKYVHLEMKRFTLRLTPFTPELHILFTTFRYSVGIWLTGLCWGWKCCLEHVFEGICTAVFGESLASIQKKEQMAVLKAKFESM